MASSKSKQKSLEGSDEILEADLGEEELEDDDLEDADLDDGELEDTGLDEVIGDDPLVVSDVKDFEEDDSDTDESAPSAKKVKDDEDDEDDDEDLEPEDLEADLDAILRDRMATSGDDEDESEGTNNVSFKGPAPADIITCASCFLGVNRSQLDNQEYCPHCGDQLVGA